MRGSKHQNGFFAVFARFLAGSDAVPVAASPPRLTRQQKYLAIETVIINVGKTLMDEG
jgi:hypothetical protein